MDFEDTDSGSTTASPLLKREDSPQPLPPQSAINNYNHNHHNHSIIPNGHRNDITTTAATVIVSKKNDAAGDDDDDNNMNDDKDDHNNDGDEKEPELLYGIEERPPWYLWLLLAFQQFLLAVISQILNPLMIAGPLCIANDVAGLGEFITGIFFVAGISSLLQTSFGIRLPIIQGPSAAFIAPIMMLMNRTKDKCPDFNNPGNVTLPFEAGSEEHKAVWMANLTELQGALMVASLVEMIVGFSGAIGFLMRYIGPLTTATVLMLIGLSVSTSASDKGSTQWWICIMAVLLIVIFSQYLRKVTVPFFGGVRIKIFLLFPVLLGIGFAWFICFILTVSGALPEEKGEWGYEARTDVKTDSLKDAQWFRIPYPGQWGTPTVSAGGVVAMIAAIMASTIESIGDYHACAKLCCVPPPPGSAISRGIGMEGVCCFLGGAWGTGSGFTSYSGNVVSIGLTRVGSRVVMQLASVMLLVVGLFVKFGTFFGTVPTPIIGGMIYVMFGMVTSVGVSSLALVDLNAVRNLFVFGFSVFFGLSAPMWIVKNPISLGNETVDEVVNIFCSTSMLMGGTIAFVLDNTVPGTLHERGIFVEGGHPTNGPVYTGLHIYDIPLIKPLLDRVRCLRCLPICPEHYRKDSPAPESRLDDLDSLTNPRFETFHVDMMEDEAKEGRKGEEDKYNSIPHNNNNNNNNNNRKTGATASATIGTTKNRANGKQQRRNHEQDEEGRYIEMTGVLHHRNNVEGASPNHANNPAIPVTSRDNDDNNDECNDDDDNNDDRNDDGATAQNLNLNQPQVGNDSNDGNTRATVGGGGSEEGPVTHHDSNHTAGDIIAPGHQDHDHKPLQNGGVGGFTVTARE